MALQLANLDDRTRRFMLDELERDVRDGTLYISDRLNQHGKADYPGLLRTAIESGDDISLAQALRLGGCMLSAAARRKPTGGLTIAKMTRNAAETLAQGEFNRFYIRGLCRRALEDSISGLVIYRAKQVRSPRPQSQARIGKMVSPQALLDDLRVNKEVEPALGVPAGANSGLSVRLP